MSQKTSHQKSQFASSEKDQVRRLLVSKLGLSTYRHQPIFAEATQSVAHFLKMPISILDILVDEEFLIQSSFGLFNIGLMNNLTRTRKMPKLNSLSFQVLATNQPLVIEKIEDDTPFTQHLLTEEYGICSYLGVPLITLDGICVGTLSVMDIKPHTFNPQDVQFLMMTARWCLMEYIYTQNINQELSSILTEELPNTTTETPTNNINFLDYTQGELLNYFTQELRTPLTSMMGMASVLKQEVYGKVTEKQKKYLEVIYDSGQYLISLVGEIIKLGSKKYTTELNCSPFDVEMLCQQVLNNLEYIAQHYQQKINLTIEPGTRIWSFDKDKIQVSLFYLILTLLESAEPGGEVRLHFSRKEDSLNFSVWLFHPWLDNSLPQMSIHRNILQHCRDFNANYTNSLALDEEEILQGYCLVSTASLQALLTKTEKNRSYRQLLELFLSCFWMEAHQGKILIYSFSDLGYRYVLSLPKSETVNN